MRRYACKFCIALYGLKGTDVPNLPQTREEAHTHLLNAHGYPPRSAREILGFAGAFDQATCNQAANLIEASGAIAEVRLIESTVLQDICTAGSPDV